MFSLQPVCGGIASAAMILQSVIIWKNDASMPSCSYLTAALSAAQMSVILHRYIVIHEKTSNHYMVNVQLRKYESASLSSALKMLTILPDHTLAQTHTATKQA